MRVVAIDTVAGSIHSALRKRQEEIHGSENSFLLTEVNGLSEYEAEPGDLVVIGVIGLAELSAMLSMIEILVAGLIQQVLIVSDMKLDILFGYSDRWEAMRIEELRQSGKLLIQSRRDWIEHHDDWLRTRSL